MPQVELDVGQTDTDGYLLCYGYTGDGNEPGTIGREDSSGPGTTDTYIIN